LFVFGERIVRAEYNERGTVLIRDLTVDRVLNEMAKAAMWVKYDSQGRKAPAKPPKDVAANVLATPNPPLPQLERIATVPFFSAEGELVSQPGYHAKTQTLCRFPRDLEFIPVPDQPDAYEIRMARNVIEKHLLVDFPFVTPADRAHATTALLHPFARPLICGPTPLHNFEKPTWRTGASLLVECICDVVGHDVFLTEARSEEEWARKIFSALRSTPMIIVIDNLKRTLDCAALAAAITASYFGDRITGTSEVGRVPVRCLWITTGNNPTMSAELLLRSIRIALMPRLNDRICGRVLNTHTCVRGSKANEIGSSGHL
jgi:hypothetical protein